MTSPDTGRAGEVRVELPWPERVTTPNASNRVHWGAKARAVRKARQFAWAATREVIGPEKPGWSGAELHWTFHPKTKNAPDDNNLGGYAKAFCDGIADALGMNDAAFRSTYSLAPPVKGGAVIVTIRGIE